MTFPIPEALPFDDLAEFVFIGNIYSLLAKNFFYCQL